MKTKSIGANVIHLAAVELEIARLLLEGVLAQFTQKDEGIKSPGATGITAEENVLVANSP